MTASSSGPAARAIASRPKEALSACGPGELSLQDPDVRRWRGAHASPPRGRARKTLNHPVAGPHTLDWSFLVSADDPGRQLLTLTDEPGTPGHDRLRILAARAAQAADQPVTGRWRSRGGGGPGARPRAPPPAGAGGRAAAPPRRH
ncbi:hypothetical protein AB0375_33840, partial [Streptomyces sp. NPDC093594]